MAGFWFHIVCEDRIYRYELGRCFATPGQALAYAARIERELAADGDAYLDCEVACSMSKAMRWRFYRLDGPGPEAVAGLTRSAT